ncbi:MAG: hypothetical protein AAFX05_00990 [Planctomycetota bacterium]
MRLLKPVPAGRLAAAIAAVLTVPMDALACGGNLVTILEESYTTTIWAQGRSSSGSGVGSSLLTRYRCNGELIPVPGHAVSLNLESTCEFGGRDGFLDAEHEAAPPHDWSDVDTTHFLQMRAPEICPEEPFDAFGRAAYSSSVELVLQESGRVEVRLVVVEIDNLDHGTIETRLTIRSDLSGVVFDQAAGDGDMSVFESFDVQVGEVLTVTHSSDFSVSQSVSRELYTASTSAVLRLNADPAWVDLNDRALLDEQGAITSDTGAFHAEGELMDGLAADGATRLLARVPVSSVVPVSVSVAGYYTEDWDADPEAGPIMIESIDGTQQGDTLELNPVQLADGRTVASFVVHAPESFTSLRSSGSDPNATSVLRRVVFAIDDRPSRFAWLEIHRPPVLLVHGLWSSPRTWNLPALQRGSPFFVEEASYEPIHDQPFDVIVQGSLITNVQHILSQYRATGVAATQVDVVGHSLGGVVSRRLITGSWTPPYRRAGPTPLAPGNFDEGDINRLIQIGSPNSGSQFATLLVNADSSLTLLGEIYQLIGDCADCGAVANLRPDSMAIQTMPSTVGEGVPSHAIVGDDGERVINEIVSGTAVPAVERASRVLIKALNFISFGNASSIVGSLHGEAHDITVGVTSAKAGLPFGGAIQTYTVYGWASGDEPGEHSALTDDSRVAQRLIELLNTPDADGTVFATGFPSPPPLPSARSVVAFPTEAVSGDVQVGSPQAGQVVTPDSLLSFSYAPMDGFDVQSAALVGLGTFEEFGEGASDLVIPVPHGTFGAVEFFVIALDGQGQYALSDPVVINVQPQPSQVRSIRIEPDSFVVADYASSRQIQVFATLTDGSEWELEPAACHFSTQDSDIVEVSSSGMVTLVGAGEAQIAARYRMPLAYPDPYDRTRSTREVDQFESEAPIAIATVNALSEAVAPAPCPGDIDGDGDTTLADFFILTTNFGATGLPYGDGESRAIGDLTDDGSVNLDDFALLANDFGCENSR